MKSLCHMPRAPTWTVTGTVPRPYWRAFNSEIWVTVPHALQPALRSGRHAGLDQCLATYDVSISGMLPISEPSTGACVSGKFSCPGRDSTTPS